jgi:GPI inositol-deacylase
VDIHNPGERETQVVMPKWFSMSEVIVKDDTMIGSAVYYIKLTGMEEAHQTLELNIVPRSCAKETHHSVAKLCVPWAEGFDRYHLFNEANTKPMYIYPPEEKPSRYNGSVNPIQIELHLDPSCRFHIVVKQSFGMTMARIVQHNAHWLFAHMVAIILLSFKHQISLTPANEEFKCGALIKALAKCTPFFIITASRVFAKMILWMKEVPQPESYDLPMMVSILIHGSALALLTLATGAIWAAICFFGNVTHKILFKCVVDKL